MQKVPSPEKPKSQSDKFKAMAKEVGADDSERTLDKMLKKIAKMPTAKANASK